MPKRPVALTLVGVLASSLIASCGSSHSSGLKSTQLPQVSLAAVDSGPRIVFRNTAIGDDYGKVAMVSLANPSGPRAITQTSCDRVYAAAANVLCLSSSRGVVTTYGAQVLNATTFRSIQTLELTGVPSRARLSRDGTLAATTSFLSGDSYANTSFSTRTTVTKVGGATYGGLEQFTLIHDGVSIEPSDRNYWGVTFASDDNTFYATVEWAGHTWLVRGDLARRRVVTLHEDAECPSLAPDGRTVVFKQRGGLPIGQWRLVGYDVATGKITRLAENRNVDDQAEWLNNSTVIYGLPRTGSQAAVDDVWAVSADGSGTPRLLIPDAWSPAVVQ